MPMTRRNIISAKLKAKRFIRDADAALARLDAENETRGAWDPELQRYVGAPRPSSGHDRSGGSPQTAQLRRTSMDLTRSLAKLRSRD
ncbi:hypothetical protein SALGADO_46 [Arthrobacter phage Salgado]|uniref:Uncharacterized protein n=1 Tax=Arthrobacter phage Salgado TaxID=1772314 RepID=A0A0U4IHS2_9CAUD|nr:hypothetical protein KMD22_gp46 [Arthrobacter phage Salgado]ALY10214.1 hypothetical protein SALGADO_46 [Arthrobacter phage Salgado]